ncbi:monocarboxylate transporter 12-like isoform X2 [Cylas formicarius]|uniref:monocarboxylate transporter 12-like isoform X2 n=1 Tax=Cylas formicarius TaxID=197179 RepID=UPI0029587C70|nr:monocarboxylate transporter 12-like isoform X2 [Cylas formicarius]
MPIENGTTKPSEHKRHNQHQIPDGGWGWLVVFASFFINLVSDGVGSTFGLLNIEFLHEFETSNSATSLIGSLFLSVPLLAGPLGSVLVDKYGCKYMTVLGVVISTAGLVLSSYVKSIFLMYVTFGFVSGFGFCLCYVTAVVSVAFWFEKKRTTALGIAASGTGFGTVIYSPLVTFLVGEYGWRGTILILAGLSANMCVSGLLMRDPDWVLEEDRASKQTTKNTDSSTKRRANRNYLLEDVAIGFSKRSDHSTKAPKNINRCFSDIVLPTYLQENQEVPLEVLKNLSENAEAYNIILDNYPNIRTYKSTSDSSLDKFSVNPAKTPPRAPVRFCMKVKEIEEDSDSDKEAPLLSRDESTKPKTHPHHYLRYIKFKKEAMGYRSAMLNIHKYKPTASSCPAFLRNSVQTVSSDEDEEWYDEYVDVLKDITHFSLFLDLHFFILSLSTVIMCVWFVVPFFYLPVHMTTFGYSDNQASFALSAIGFTNIIGMVLLGWIGDRLNCTKMFAGCLICCGFTCWGLMYFTDNYVVLIIFCGLFGLFFASCYALPPTILAELVPLDKFTMAYGLFLLCQGIGNLAGPPIAGLLYDLTKSYEQSFYQAAIWVILSGLLVMAIPYTDNRRLFDKSSKRVY